VKDATEHTRTANAAAARELPFDDRQDFEDARRGLVADAGELVIRDGDGHVIWDLASFGFLEPGPEGDGAADDVPATVHPALWRQARLNSIAGLFEVAEGVYQVRGYDISNMTLVEGERGVVVVDPLISVECAAAALALYREHRGDRPVTGMLYTHSHGDHFGGAKGVVDADRVAAGDVPVWAPVDFLEHAVSENVLAGNAMARRSMYMFGNFLERGARGQIDCGIGKTSSTGTVSLIPPTHDVTETGQRATIDGVEFVFQLVPETEAPAEFNFLIPERRALCVAEIATHTLHNILTPRGALVRDALRWSKYLNETVELFAGGSEVMLHGHHWPCWGNARITEMLRRHRDVYRYVHDQAVRLMNDGLTGTEIAAAVELPASLASSWSCRGFYGTVSHNVRAVYQRYLGYFDGTPANLDPLPPEEAGRNYVELAGGADALLAKAREAFERGEYRWVAELTRHLVFADPASEPARELEADALEQLGYRSESAIWRNYYLAGAQELREGVAEVRDLAARGRDVARILPVDMLFDAMGARVNGPRAAESRIVVNWRFTDLEQDWTMTIENGALSTVLGRHAGDADATITLTRGAMDAMLFGGPEGLAQLPPGELEISGSNEKLGALLGLFERPEPGFAIVTP
jgi:alkyl sulfatase BDS1-like metallo-beta-lactamase superfamily hydrolase